MRLQKGSMWWKWDLHVHTPLSLSQNYGGDTPEAWEAFFNDLESLPNEFKVLGINDYIFIDGYRKVLAAKSAGRLKNIDLILPVIELRLDKFGGTKSNWSRVNYHIIFSNELDADTIESQFLYAIKPHYQLDPDQGSRKSSWKGIITIQSLKDLGQQIISSVPEDEQKNFASPLVEGFNNLNVSVGEVTKALSAPYFEKKFLTAVGKTEWADIKWNDNTIAEKKTILNSADFVFTAAASVDHCGKALASLQNGLVNSRLLDCSDAHDFSSATIKDRIGNCNSWICADTEFEGLRQARREYKDRVFLGEIPPIKKNIVSYPTRYIKSVQLEKTTASTLNENWFNGTNLELNAGLVTVIGNKGSGKSALVDILGLLGNSSRLKYASFLNEDRFCRIPENKAAHFEGELLWESGEKQKHNLSYKPPSDAKARITYIPQSLFETICNELSQSKRSKFDEELKQVIFNHVPQAERADCNTLDELIKFHTDQIQVSIDQDKVQLSALNRRIVDQELKLEHDYRSKLEEKKAVVEHLLEVHNASKPIQVIEPHVTDNRNVPLLEQINQKRGVATQLEERIKLSNQRLATINVQAINVTRAKQILETLDQTIKISIENLSQEVSGLGIQTNELVKYEINLTKLNEKATQLDTEKQTLTKSVDENEPGSDAHKLKIIKSEIDQFQVKLNEPERLYHQYVNALEQWTLQYNKLIGSANQVESVTWVNNQLQEISNVPQLISELETQRINITRQVYQKLTTIASYYRQAYQPVQQFIEEEPIARDQIRLQFGVNIENDSLEAQFFDCLNRGKSGTFFGIVESDKVLKDFIAQYDFNNEDQVLDFTNALLNRLKFDHRKNPPTSNSIGNQLRDGKFEADLLDFIFSLKYLVPRYQLKMGERNIESLSPGEKGALLLVFYLLVDKNDNPLIIDQPEENLDNQTIYKLLVPAIKKAKKHRQIIMVTHNANLAVVCDSEQVICASRDIQMPTNITYNAGSIENPVIQKNLLDILEGTQPALENRYDKLIG